MCTSLCFHQDAVHMLVVTPTVELSLVAGFVVANDVKLLWDPAFGVVTSLLPNEEAVDSVVRLDFAEHNVAGEDLRYASQYWTEEAHIAGINQWFEGAAIAAELDGFTLHEKLLQHFVPLPGQEPP